MTRIKKWKKFLLENASTDVLRYYIFDWDENLLFMNTPLHFQHFENGRWVNKDLNGVEFAQVRKKYPTDYMDNNEWKGDPKSSFIDFRDYGPRGTNAFLEDTKNAIKEKKFGPSWETFLDVLKNGKLFAIVTMRGHEPSTIRSVIRYIIENVLTTEQQAEMINNLKKFNEMFGVKTEDTLTQYLNECYFIGLNSQAFVDEFNYVPQGTKLNQGKQDAINKFVNFVRGFAERAKKPMRVGFSDDDKNFYNAAKELFMKMEKSLDFPENFYVFDTSNPDIKGGVKVKI
jgi:hypothetical protein